MHSTMNSAPAQRTSNRRHSPVARHTAVAALVGASVAILTASAVGPAPAQAPPSIAAVSAAFASNSGTFPVTGPNGARGTYTMSAELRRLEGCTLVVHQRATLQYDGAATATFDLDAETTFPLGEIDPASVVSTSRPLPRSDAQPAFFAHLATTGGALAIERRTNRATFNGAVRTVPDRDKDEDISARDQAAADRIAAALRAAVAECQRRP